jgi:TRAP-type C4-dicarboxylate transport system permease small subunit
MRAYAAAGRSGFGLTDDAETPERLAAVQAPGVRARLQALLDRINAVLIVLSALALGTAGCVLTWEVLGRYFFKIPSVWQDELSVMLLVGATFGAASWIQTRRGHVAVDVLHHVLPAAADRWRRIATALVASAFCSFFAWKCWTLLAEAVDEGQTSNSPWAPPLWIPYGIMAVGMTMLAAQTVLQFAGEIRSVKAR